MITMRTDHPFRYKFTGYEKEADVTSLMRESATGNADAEILPLLNQLNNIPHVCTISSCAGHTEGEGSTPYVAFGVNIRPDIVIEQVFHFMHQVFLNGSEQLSFGLMPGKVLCYNISAHTTKGLVEAIRLLIALLFRLEES